MLSSNFTVIAFADDSSASLSVFCMDARPALPSQVNLLLLYQSVVYIAVDASSSIEYYFLSDNWKGEWDRRLSEPTEEVQFTEMLDVEVNTAKTG